MTQDEMLGILGLAGDPFAEGVFARCGVNRRRLEVSPQTLDATLQARTPESEERLLRLAVEAIDDLEIEPDDVGVLISANYYSLGGPTLAHRLVEHYGLAPDTDKHHLVGAGCASAVPLFRLADQVLRDRPGQKALVVAAESVSGFLTSVLPGDDRVKVVGSALFGDGCGVALLARGEASPGPAIVATAVHQVRGTLDHVRFGVTGADSHMQIDRELPVLAESALRPLVDAFLGRHELTSGGIDHWLVHPGGRGVVEGIQRGLGLSDEQVAVSTHVLSEFGNVGTPASFFVLGETLSRHRPGDGDHGLMVTIGPGVTIGLMLLAW
ncbi:MAG TPA: 3-oxoacyl-[acyl-carrier-protein] synthase III C-terminal domain-containing protein [Thermoleophilaceae bacterium]|nr:3-oxoacyl-[acyl-carrier-protein] synthase III C-terminal domain-containing protein [Thermoleophilaceae bacterium]